MPPVTEQDTHLPAQVTRIGADGRTVNTDTVAVEEPMEIRIVQSVEGVTSRRPIAITMRTPGDDFELAIGFLFGEGLIASREDFVDVSYCLDDDVQEEQYLNVVSVTLRTGLDIELSRVERNFYTTSSCGVCGKASLEALEMQACTPLTDGLVVDPTIIQQLPERLRSAQSVFQKTGGLHGAGLFDANGKLLDLCEDVGRHNALDKLIGKQVIAGQARQDDRILLLSGRASFELLQKALMARIPIVAAVGAPSSLAVSLAANFNITLCGFVRADGFNVYSAPERLSRG
ncbi:MAG: formate dehydrogenase accessory sulfurtransferase FdhD [Thermomicrobiales bacterium]|nr:formate dehydrogenase accessory sulfurtransferase FdhD [Thermomicrobiales bacterium]